MSVTTMQDESEDIVFLRVQSCSDISTSGKTSDPQATRKAKKSSKPDYTLTTERVPKRKYPLAIKETPEPKYPGSIEAEKFSKSRKLTEARKVYTREEFDQEPVFKIPEGLGGYGGRVVAWLDLAQGTRVVVSTRFCKYDVVPAANLMIPFVKNPEQRIKPRPQAEWRNPQIVGVAYSDDGNGSELMNPAMFSTKKPPRTYVKIRWDFTDITWETRSMARKFFGGTCIGDMVIFAAAKKFEKMALSSC